MRTVIVWLLVIFGLVQFCKNSADPTEDEIVNVPGYGSGAPRVFGGRLDIKNNATLHYILVESKNGPNNNDPLTLWMSSEPGCSSKLGFLNEIGPFILPPGSKYDAKMTPNPFSWHQASNLLFIDGPQGVGFSQKGTIPYIYNDQNAAEDILYGLLAFFVKFPSFQGKSFYLAGESYAGKTIPDLALRIVAYNLNSESKIGLRAILVGNGVMDLSDNQLEKSQINYMFSHNFVDPTLDKYWYIACQADPSSAGCAFFLRRYDDLLSKVNFHNIYGTCPSDPTLSTSSNSRTYALSGYQNKKMQFYNNIKKCQAMKTIDDYFLHNRDAFHGPSDTFVTCNEDIYNTYDRTIGGSMNQYSRLITSADVRIHLYGGDWDDIVPFENTLRNIERLGLRQSAPVSYWTNLKSGQHLGFKRTYIQNQKTIKYWIVKGAGHEVPQQKPQVALELFKAFLGNQS